MLALLGGSKVKGSDHCWIPSGFVTLLLLGKKTLWPKATYGRKRSLFWLIVLVEEPIRKAWWWAGQRLRWWAHLQPEHDELEAGWGGNLSKPVSSDVLPPVRADLLKVPQLHKHCPPPGNRVFIRHGPMRGRVHSKNHSLYILSLVLTTVDFCVSLPS